jgi:hypothetical protein
MENNIKDDPKYFYIVVLITFGLIGIIVWQLFFTNYEPFVESKTNIEEIPQINFPFLDSFAFQGLNSFKKADEPLLSWEGNRSNPFTKPSIPEDQTARNWWGVFNIKLSLTNEGLIGVYPSLIEGEINPKLILFENRVYSFTVEGSAETEDCSFTVENEAGIPLHALETEEENEFSFKATTETLTYSCLDKDGQIEIIESENFQANEFENRFAGNFETMESNLKKLTELVAEENQELYSNFEERFNRLKEDQTDNNVSSNLLFSEINEFNREINKEIDNIEFKREKEEIISILKIEERLEVLEGEKVLPEVKVFGQELEEKINNLKNEDLIMRISQPYEDLKSNINQTKEGYNNQEINEEELKEEVINFYNQFQNSINRLEV